MPAGQTPGQRGARHTHSRAVPSTPLQSLMPETVPLTRTVRTSNVLTGPDAVHLDAAFGGDGFVLSGAKTLVESAGQADVLLVSARTAALGSTRSASSPGARSRCSRSSSSRRFLASSG